MKFKVGDNVIAPKGSGKIIYIYSKGSSYERGTPCEVRLDPLVYSEDELELLEGYALRDCDIAETEEPDLECVVTA